MCGVVKVEVKNVYGNMLIYPANEKAESFCVLVGKKSLSKKDLKLIEGLGFKIEQVVDAYSLDMVV